MCRFARKLHGSASCAKPRPGVAEFRTREKQSLRLKQRLCGLGLCVEIILASRKRDRQPCPREISETVNTR